MVTLILTLLMCFLLFLMIWSATYFYPWTGLLEFFPTDVKVQLRTVSDPLPCRSSGFKAFDIIALDYVLVTKTQFFQHYIPETKGCAGYHNFGYNRKEQLKRIVTLPLCAVLIAWICTLF